MTLAFTVVAILFAVVTMPGCNKSRKIPKDFDYGSWTGSTYRNDFFGFSITVPEDWHIAGKEEMKALLEDAEADASTAGLFYTARYSADDFMKNENEDFNPNIVLIVENLSLPGRKIDTTKYVSLYRKNLSPAMPGHAIQSETNKTIGGQEFTSLQSQSNFEGIHISQEHLICVKNNYAVIFVLTTLDDSEKPQLDDIMATLKWD